MSLCVWSVWCVVLVIVQISGGQEEEECYGGAEASTQLSHWISRALFACRLAEGGCQVEQFQDIQLTRLEAGDGRTWYITSSPGWSRAHRLFPRVEAYQGAFYYEAAPGETGGVPGVYIYPDWSSCVSGTWRGHTLEQGGYCRLTHLCLHPTSLPSLRTEASHNLSLTYSPPSYSNTGLPPTSMDPFENNTVEVRPSHIPGSNEGLFTTRAVARGELVSFYSGLITKCDNILSPLNRRKPSTQKDVMKIKMYLEQHQSDTISIYLDPCAGTHFSCSMKLTVLDNPSPQCGTICVWTFPRSWVPWRGSG